MPYYLVQRMSSKKDAAPRGNGFDDYFELDYMGSSEFEWGAIPAALKSIRQHPAVVQEWPVTINGLTRSVYFVGEKKALRDHVAGIEAWSERGDHRPPFWGKEWTNFPENFADTADEYARRTDAWWAIKDDVAWSLDPAVADKLAAAFNSRPSKH